MSSISPTPTDSTPLSKNGLPLGFSIGADLGDSDKKIEAPTPATPTTAAAAAAPEKKKRAPRKRKSTNPETTTEAGPNSSQTAEVLTDYLKAILLKNATQQQGPGFHRLEEVPVFGVPGAIHPARVILQWRCPDCQRIAPGLMIPASPLSPRVLDEMDDSCAPSACKRRNIGQMIRSEESGPLIISNSTLGFPSAVPKKQPALHYPHHSSHGATNGNNSHQTNQKGLLETPVVEEKKKRSYKRVVAPIIEEPEEEEEEEDGNDDDVDDDENLSDADDDSENLTDAQIQEAIQLYTQTKRVSLH